MRKLAGKIDIKTSVNRHERGLEFKVGILFLVGGAVRRVLVQFGRLGEL